jgi:hypothetical protein
MGHACVQITLDRYSYLLRDTRPDQAARLSGLVFGPTVANGLLTGGAQTAQETVEQKEKMDGRQSGLSNDDE